VRRFVITAVSIVAFALVAGPAGAGGGGATAETFPTGTFVITSATCSELAPGTTLTGSGTEKSVTVEKTNNGVTRIHNTSHATGTAVDQDGNTYVFDYSNSFNISDAGSPGVFTGIMNDHFSLAGNGPARLNNGFQAVFSTDRATFVSLTPLKSHGDPLDFTTVTARCDPL
jgi:hypothetical protein